MIKFINKIYKIVPICIIFIFILVTNIDYTNKLIKNNDEINILKLEIREFKNNQIQYNEYFLKYNDIIKYDIKTINENIDYIENSNNDQENYDIKYIDEENILTIIRLICDWREFDYRIAYATAIHESALNPEATNLNSDGTTDWGLYQFNDITLECYAITPEIALNPYTATEYYILIMNNLIEKYGLYDGLRAYAAGEWGMLNGGGTSFANDIIKMLEEYHS